MIAGVNMSSTSKFPSPSWPEYNDLCLPVLRPTAYGGVSGEMAAMYSSSSSSSRRRCACRGGAELAGEHGVASLKEQPRSRRSPLHRGLYNRVFAKTTIHRFCQYSFSRFCGNPVFLIHILGSSSKQNFSLLHGYFGLQKTSSPKLPYPNKASRFHA